jgi:hypothetical protein
MAESEAAAPAGAAETVLVVHPGDIVQVTDPAHPWKGLILLVEATHGWGIHGQLQAPGRLGDKPGTVNVVAGDNSTVTWVERFKPGQFAVCGAAAIMPPEVAAARRASIETAAEVAREAAR